MQRLFPHGMDNHAWNRLLQSLQLSPFVPLFHLPISKMKINGRSKSKSKIKSPPICPPLQQCPFNRESSRPSKRAANAILSNASRAIIGTRLRSQYKSIYASIKDTRLWVRAPCLCRDKIRRPSWPTGRIGLDKAD